MTWDVVLYASCLVVADIIDKKFILYVKRRIEVWKKGYGLLCDIDGVLYVYAIKKNEVKK